MYKQGNFNSKILPPAYMEQFCRSLHPDLDLSSTCLSWFRQATEHCTGLMLNCQKPGSQFWKTVKNFIFPDYQTGLLNQKIPISIHPNRLSIQNCHSLFLDIVNDYILRAPRYSAERETNVLLWQILYSLMGIMALGSFLISTIFAYRKFGKSLQKSEHMGENAIFQPEKRAQAFVKRNMRMLKYELKRLRVCHVTQPEELIAPDGASTLVIKISSKLSLVNGIVASNIQSTGRLYRRLERKRPDYRTETVNKILNYLNNYSRKLRVLFIFDEDPVYEELLRKGKNQNPPKFAAAKTPTPTIPLKSGTLHESPSPRSAKLTQIPRNVVPRRNSTSGVKKKD